MTWPWEMLYYLVILTSFRSWASTAEEIVTLTPAEDVSVPRNDTGFTTFVCETNRTDIMWWLVNGTSSVDDSVRNRGVTTTTPMEHGDSDIFWSTLSISTNISNNNTIILCQAIVIDGDEQVLVNSTSVLLHVEDRPGPPLQTVILPSDGAGKELLMWNAPATGRVLHFKVCVNVTADSLKCYNVNGRKFTFRTVGVNLLFTVSAVNAVGEGPNSSALYKACQGM